MSNLLRAILWTLAFAGCAVTLPAGAGPIVNGVEWYQPADVTNYAWSDFHALCPSGLCSGQLGGSGPDLTGWVWASVWEVGDLFSALTPHAGGISTYLDLTPYQDPWWAIQFMNVFDPTVNEVAPPEFARGVVGLTSTRDAVSGTPYWGLVGISVTGWIAPGMPEIDGIAETGLSRLATPNASVGAWLYRYDPAPVPATIPLLVIALACLVGTRRRPAPL